MHRAISLAMKGLTTGLLVVFSLACHSSPTKPLGDPLLKFTRQPADGFCPQEGKLFKSTIWKNTSGTHTLTGTVLVGFDGQHDSCVVTIGRCLAEVPFRQHVLTTAEATQLQTLLAAIPTEAPPINFACDPCVITRYEFDGRTVDNNPCFEISDAADAYRQSLTAVEDLLRVMAEGTAY
ncbi:MAG: hypothetical protein HZB43_04085 [candidate division Zixibacteria bacterium]|nr:hypothetical protein [candidate division Zixibacteria bacterium]